MPNTLVLEPDILIAQDIFEIVRGQLPRADIVVETDLRIGIETFEASTSWDLVIANNILFQGPMRRIRDTFQRSDGLKIMLDTVEGGPQDCGDGWVPLSFPFSEATMCDALRHWRGSQNGN